MKKAKCSISVVTIARNEEKTISTVLEKAARLLPQIATNYEILVNDDASQDKTLQLAKQVKRTYPYIKIYHHSKPLGIAKGLEFLYQKAQYDVIFTNPGDGQYLIGDLPKFLHKYEKGYDLVVGKRHSKQYTFDRKIISHLFNYLPGLLFGYKLYDAGSVKLLSKNVLLATTPSSKGVFGEAERIILAYNLGFKVTSVPISHISRQGGKATGAKINLINEALMDMAKLWVDLKTNNKPVKTYKAR